MLDEQSFVGSDSKMNYVETLNKEMISLEGNSMSKKHLLLPHAKQFDTRPKNL